MAKINSIIKYVFSRISYQFITLYDLKLWFCHIRVDKKWYQIDTPNNILSHKIFIFALVDAFSGYTLNWTSGVIESLYCWSYSINTITRKSWNNVSFHFFIAMISLCMSGVKCLFKVFPYLFFSSASCLGVLIEILL